MHNSAMSGVWAPGHGLQEPVVLALPSWRQAPPPQTRASCSLKWGSGGDFSFKSKPRNTFRKFDWLELGHVLSPEAAIGKEERAGLQPSRPPRRTPHLVPGPSWGSVARKRVGVNVRLETH